MPENQNPGDHANDTTKQHGAARTDDRARPHVTARSGDGRATMPRAVPQRRGHVVAVRSSVSGDSRVPSG